MIAAEGLQLNGNDISLADIHLSPMIAYFAKVPKAADLLSKHPTLSAWWAQLCNRPSLTATDPFVMR
ncbi:glutathione binding-like protein [Sulfitobacter sp. MF3-043]|uniref:glutathione binding-like protein n=1 Tax=Sulfitobacter sediminivivens TaxID=3252902 RepID=UPI003EBEAED6